MATTSSERTASPRTSTRPVCEVVFRSSREPRYREALRIARTVPGYRAERDGRRVRHVVPVEGEAIAPVQSLLNIVRCWPDSAVVLDGEALAGERVADFMWMLACYQASRMGGSDTGCWGVAPVVGGHLPCRLLNSRLTSRPDAEYADPEALPRRVAEHERATLARACPNYNAESVLDAARKCFLRGRGRGRQRDAVTAT